MVGPDYWNNELGVFISYSYKKIAILTAHKTVKLLGSVSPIMT